MGRKKYIQQVVQRIAKALHPISIVLFGSYAYGAPREDSDFDILVITRTKRSSDKLIHQIEELFSDRLKPMDFIVRTPKEITNRIRKGDFFLEEVMKKGKVLYGQRTI